MNCDSCSAVLPEGAHFCPNCSTRVHLPQGAEPQDSLLQTLESALGFQYRIDRLLGRGGMGAVYLAHELALDRAVAIKALLPNFATAGELRERFKREARTAARLTHPNIVPLYTFGEVAGLTYFVMGYVKGESLGDRLKRLGRMEPVHVQAILCDVADALGYAHRQGVIHRDVKPDNILIDADSGRPMLADFGIAKATESGTSLTGTGHVVGTPHYMSPEQCSGRTDLDGRTDLYALGVTGYQMLSGRLPFEGKTPSEVLMQQMTRPAPPLKQMAGGEAPDLLVAAIERCLAKDPAERWSDAASLKRALSAEATIQDEPQEYRLLRASVQVGVVATVLRLDINLLRMLNRGLESALAGFAPLFAQFFLILQLTCLFLAAMTAAGIRVRYKDMGLAILRCAFVQPLWWPFWYPRAMRRPGDVWHLWPSHLRWLWHAAAAACSGILVLAWSIHLEMFTPYRGSLRYAALVWVMVAFAWMMTQSIFALRFVRQRIGAAVARRGDEQKALVQPAFSVRFWRRPPFNSLLQPEGAQAPPGTAAATPEGEAIEITRIVRELPGGLEPLGQAARSAAENLCASIRALEQEIARLAHDADPNEAIRLRVKLDALGPAAPDEPIERVQLRQLLAQQSGLVSGIEQRLKSANRERDCRMQFLRRLRLEVANLRAEAANATVVSGKTPERLRDLCSEIAQRAQGAGQSSTSVQTATVAGPDNGTSRPEE